MKSNTVSTRRRFFWKAGAVLSAPVAAGVDSATARGSADRTLAARITFLEDVDAVRELHYAYARLLGRGAHAEAAALFLKPSESRFDDTVRMLSADRLVERNTVEITRDGKTATARIRCTVEIATMIEPRCTLVDMARGQGEGVVRRSETRVLEGRYVKREGVWKIAHAAWHPVADAH
jgi:hypothetical protein